MPAGHPVRVLHVLDPEFGWHFTSPDVDGMVGGGKTYEEARGRAEFLVRSHLESRPGHHRDPRTSQTVQFAHFVNENAGGVRDLPEPVAPPL